MAIQDNKPTISVIVAVYNHFEWLRLVLDALRMQTDKDFEVIIADDGSNTETVRKIQEYIAKYPDIQIIHSWQPDEGWRKNKSLNNAVRQSTGEYLIFIDGDCIPHPRFVEDHRRIKREGIVMGGRRVETTPAISEMLESWDSLPANCFKIIRKKILKLILKDGVSSAIKQFRRTIRFPFFFGQAFGKENEGILGANFGIYRKDLDKVNGFDERYINPGTGEDTDLDLRLANAGVRHMKASHYMLMLHRHHPRLETHSKENAELLTELKTNQYSYVPTGLYKDKD